MFLKKKLKRLYDEDQKPRIEYMELIYQCDNDWKVAQNIWITCKKANPNDMFSDFSSKRQKKAQALIRRRFRKILKNDELTTYAWLLVQHSNDVNFQRWFLNKLDKSTDNYQYLYDRVCVNTGTPQKYNTQNIID